MNISTLTTSVKISPNSITSTKQLNSPAEINSYSSNIEDSAPPRSGVNPISTNENLFIQSSLALQELLNQDIQKLGIDGLRKLIIAINQKFTNDKQLSDEQKKLYLLKVVKQVISS